MELIANAFFSLDLPLKCSSENSIDVLGFDPYTQEYKAVEGLYELTPERAAYILKHHNKDNRAFSDGQKAKLRKSKKVCALCEKRTRKRYVFKPLNCQYFLILVRS